MWRLSSLAILLGILLVLDEVFFHGQYRDTAWEEMNNGAQFINRAAQNVVGRFNR
jgi:hypothetical protein